MQRLLFALLAAAALTLAPGRAPAGQAAVTHSFFAAGNETRIVGGDGKVLWSYPKPTRDGSVLPNGNVLLALSGKPGGVVEVTRAGQVVFEWKGTQDETDTVQRLPDGNTLVSEAGPNPRLLELDPRGAIVRELRLDSQRGNPHMQQRMSRKLPNGHYLVPHLWDRIVREYDGAGKVVWEVRTPHMPFTAIRLPDGNTLIGCTWGNLVIEVNPQGEIVWQVDNEQLPTRPLNDCCGVQRLPNGNTVITSYRNKAGEPRLTEVTRDKKIVWTYTDTRPSGVHHFQILDTNGTPLRGAPLR
jgi:hypothetical protein